MGARHTALHDAAAAGRPAPTRRLKNRDPGSDVRPVLTSPAADPPIADPEAIPSEHYGRYQLVERIGKGGMAEVFRAVTEGLEGFRRVFVIKRIRPEKSDSAEFIQMFCDEARICALLHHPNIVQVYDFGQIRGTYFMAMEYLRGKDLSSVMRALRAACASVPAPVAAYVTQQVALGLHHAHTASLPGGAPGQIVHRDVTPSNIMLLRTGGVKILDFGIAKAAAVARQIDTQNGRVKGKLAYLSPEQVRAGELDGRSDVFALGVVLWEMLTGQRLFAGENEFQTMRNVLLATVPKPSSKQPEIPAALDAVVARALERDPGRRYPSAQALADDLERVLRDTPCSSQAVPRLLQDLFGEDRGDDTAEAGMQSAASPLPGPAAASPAVVAAAVAAAAALPLPADDGPSWTHGALSPERGARANRRRALALAAGATLAACFGWAAWKRHRQTGLARPEAAAPAAVVKAAAAPAPVADPVEPATVTITIESTPPGAAVSDGDGAALGVTPLSLALPRSPGGKTLTLSKTGYAPAVHTVVPDRAQTLRAALEPAIARAPRAHRAGVPGGAGSAAGAAGRGQTSDITIDPFARP